MTLRDSFLAYVREQYGTASPDLADVVADWAADTIAMFDRIGWGDPTDRIDYLIEGLHGTRPGPSADTITEYYLNGEHLDGWDETGATDINPAAAVQNLTDWKAGDVLTARLYKIDGVGRTLLDEQATTLEV